MFHRPWTPGWVRMGVAAMAVAAATCAVAKADGDAWQQWSGSDSPSAVSRGTDNQQNTSQPLVYDMAPAMARAAVAQAQYDRASINLTDVQIRARLQFEHSPEYRAAVQELSDAQGAYEAACQPVENELMDNPAYRSLIEKRTQTQVALDNSHGDRAVATAITTLKMEYSAAASKMEAEALADDAQVRDAKVRLIAARQTLDSMTERFEDSFADRPAVAAAWQNYQDSIINRAGAQGYLDGAMVTRADVLLTNQQRYSGTQYSYCAAWPYGYGYSPYWYGYYGVLVRRF